MHLLAPLAAAIVACKMVISGMPDKVTPPAPVSTPEIVVVPAKPALVLPSWAKGLIPNGVPQEIADFISFIADPERFERVGAHMPRGILMYGPPGTGKTLLARTIAEATATPFFYASATSFKKSLVGDGAQEVRSLFEKAAQAAQKEGKAIIFIDELDAIGSRQQLIMQSGHDEALMELLVQMDGFVKHPGLIVIAATNTPERIDPALLRPGRFDYKIEIGLPDVDGRKAIIKHYLATIAYKGKRVQLIEDIALATEGFSGADIKALMNAAALRAARKGAVQVTKKDIFKALEEKEVFIDKNY